MTKNIILNSIQSFNIQQKDQFKSSSAVIEKNIKNDDNTEKTSFLTIGGLEQWQVVYFNIAH